MDQIWAILIYTVPAAPTRKRAAVWRELKKVGAVYLRDGVCALPDREGTIACLRAIAARVEGYDGEATLVEAAHLDAHRAAAIVARSRADRAAEYAEIGRAAEGLLAHVGQEMAHRAFPDGEVGDLGRDVEKLRRWAEQVRTRDYFGSAEATQVAELLNRCDDTLAAFTAGTAPREEAPR